MVGIRIFGAGYPGDRLGGGDRCSTQRSPLTRHGPPVAASAFCAARHLHAEKVFSFFAPRSLIVEDMRAVLAVLALTAFGGLSGCVELGVVTDGSSISYGKPNNGYLVDGVKLPDKGDGYTTREVWSLRGNRYGTDELVTLVKGVAKRMKKKVKDVRLVVADLSNTTGGAEHAFHRSHQNGRDADLLYYMRDSEGKPFEADAMHVFNARGEATDGSGITVDVPRTWLLVKELLTAREAYVQYI